MKRIVINLDEENEKATIEEGSIEDLFHSMIYGGEEFIKMILDSVVTILANTSHQELLLSDLFRSLAIAKEDPLAMKELGITPSSEEEKELKNILGEDLATLAKVSGDA